MLRARSRRFAAGAALVAVVTTCCRRGRPAAAFLGPDVSISLLCSKLLSLGVVAGALVGKLPQVHAIWKARSAAGVSVISIWTEAASLGIQFAYNMVRRTPLSTYAEVPILFLQLILLGLTAAWAEGYLGPMLWTASLCLVGCTAALALSLVPTIVTVTLYGANVALSLVIVGPQVLMTYRNRSTGQLSFVVAAMTFSGLTTRLVTTLIEVEDLGVRMAIGLNWLLMAVLLLQFLLFPSEKAGPSATGKDVAGISHISLVDCAANLGSSPCLLLLGEETTFSPMLKSHSWHPPNSVQRLRRNFNSWQGELLGIGERAISQ